MTIRLSLALEVTMLGVQLSISRGEGGGGIVILLPFDETSGAIESEIQLSIGGGVVCISIFFMV